MERQRNGPNVKELARLWNIAHRDEANYLNSHLLPVVIDPIIIKGKSVLDVGCGAHEVYDYSCTTQFLKYLAGRYIGLDISKVAVEKARETSEGTFVIGEATAIPFADKSFDVVVMADTLPLMGRHAYDAICELVRVSKEKVIFTTRHTDMHKLPVEREIIGVEPETFGTVFRNPGFDFERNFMDERDIMNIGTLLRIDTDISVFTERDYFGFMQGHKAAEQAHGLNDIKEFICVVGTKKP